MARERWLASARTRAQWERDITLVYVFPNGSLKDLGFTWISASLRSELPASGSDTPTQRDQDENRLIVSYTLPLL
ncbi:outer membrane porin, OprD family [compost metagenome]